jgi:uncharacterized Fe-S cluster protein YjdI
MQATYIPLHRRYCTAEHPMPIEDKDRYQWGHPDAVEVEPFFNLVIYTCPHCNHTFHALPREPE